MEPYFLLPFKSDLRLVVDLQDNVTARQSHAYAQKVKISNLQQMAKTIAYVQEHQTELELYEAAVKFLQGENADGKIPSMRHHAAPDEIFHFKSFSSVGYISQNLLRNTCPQISGSGSRYSDKMTIV